MRYSIRIQDLSLSRATLLGDNNRVLVRDLGTLLSKHELAIGTDWLVRIKIRPANNDGSIIVKYTGRAINKTKRSRFRLRDGELILSDDYYKVSCKFNTQDLDEILKDRFGITELKIADPNQIYRGHFKLFDDCSQISFRVISDRGEAEYYVPNNNTFTVDGLADLHYNGPLSAKIEDATWAVVCEGPDDELGKECHFCLYTDCPNRWFLIPQLETFLEKSGWGRFEDALTDFEYNPEYAELFDKQEEGE